MTSFEVVGEGGLAVEHFRIILSASGAFCGNVIIIEVITGKTETWMSWKIGHLAYNDFPNFA